MNFKEMVSRIGRDLQFSPTDTEYVDDVKAAIRDAYVAVLEAEPWPFRYREWTFRVFPDVDVANADVLALQKVRKLTLSYTPFVDGLGDGLTGDLAWALRGNRLEVGNSAEVPLMSAQSYVIEEAGFTGVYPYLWLDPRFTLTTEKEDLSDIGDVTVRFDRYKLPEDCAKVSEVALDPDGTGRFSHVLLDSSVQDLTGTGYDPHQTGRPAVWQFATRRRQGSNRASHPTMQTATWTGGAGDVPHRAPRKAPTVTFTSGGSLEVGTTYEWAYSWYFSGEETGLSPSVKGRPTSGRTAELAGLEVLGTDEYGRTRIIYRREEGRGWERVGTVGSPTTATFTDGGAAVASIDPLIDELAPAAEGSGWVSMYPRPDAGYPCRVTYLVAPPPLIHDTDMMIIPARWAHVVVARVVADMLAVRHGDERAGARAEQAYERKLSAMRAALLRPADLPSIEKGSAGGRASSRYGVVSEVVQDGVTYDFTNAGARLA